MSCFKRGAAAPRKLPSATVRVVMASVLLGPSLTAWAQPSSIGLSGLIHMPSARMEEDGMLTTGFSYAKPYSAPYIGAQILPFLQVAGNYTRVIGLADTSLGDKYGDYKDKAASLKLRLLPENAWGQWWIPEIAAGINDAEGTKIYRSEFIAANKKIDLGYGTADLTLGYGRKRISGAYGGARLQLYALPSWALVTEYDKNNYNNDLYFNRTGLPSRQTGSWNAALEYTWGALTLQAGRQRNQNIYNVSLAIPLQQREFIPKSDEVGPFENGAWASDGPRPTLHQWETDRIWRQSLLRKLHAEGLRNVRMAWRDGTMAVTVSSDRYRYASRGVGRTARLVMAYAPLETERVEITWETLDMAGMTWVFDDATVLQRYFAGTATRAELASAVQLHYADPHGRSEAARANDLDSTLDELGANDRIMFGRNLLSLRGGTTGQSNISLTPYVSTFLNDPSGAFKYDLGLNLGAQAHLGRGWWFNGSVMGSVIENVSDVTQKSNSELPHVRSDLAEYRHGAKVKISSLMLSKYWQPAERTYVRASAGLYEEMFGGAGVQALYLHSGGRLAWDIAIDGVRQRDFKGTGFQDYKTVTALASMHYQVPGFDGLTATVRTGRFLARDNGVRLELSRTFRSGVQLGMWYTRTNGNDTQSPGSPSSPYMDKGVFMRIPLSTMMTRDTGSIVNFSLSPWNRDVGQMVASPNDLYQTMRSGWLDNVQEGDGLRSFGDVPTEDTP